MTKEEAVAAAKLEKKVAEKIKKIRKRGTK